ncbi:hypothetical protein A2V71_02020 [Candidatus Berkelbacteria bacterium RBG_13_40_8]|uniref:Uncharacterized protein n=1 Tax=Candidatus Berkelbacteria bacterium RBG_13_40_8 TaxID=1797467 RepID=A0A1F5DPX8_9BACT|nr:MAG: hypothetical protein A2V71_02020 [Candidatus Berkelbacteria bacterium RBG_13_40_8]
MGKMESVKINPRPVSYLDLKKIKPKYGKHPKFEEQIVERIGQMEPLQGVDPYLMVMLRNKLIDQAEIMGRHGMMKVREIADHNCREEERATALKWYLTLHQLFAIKSIQDFPVKKRNGRIQIGIPGCFNGFETGGLLDFFNEQKIAIDIRACDVLQAGGERSFLRLSERQAVMGSTVRLCSWTPAKTYFADKSLDIVIFRHSGPIFKTTGYRNWHNVFKTVLKTEPSLVIVSTNNYPITNLAVKKAEGKNPDDALYEGYVFVRWLQEAGYHVPFNDESTIFDKRGLLTRLRSIYGIPFVKEGKEPSIDQYCDILMFLALKPGLFN